MVVCIFVTVIIRDDVFKLDCGLGLVAFVGVAGGEAGQPVGERLRVFGYTRLNLRRRRRERAFEFVPLTQLAISRSVLAFKFAGKHMIPLSFTSSSQRLWLLSSKQPANSHPIAEEFVSLRTTFFGVVARHSLHRKDCTPIVLKTTRVTVCSKGSRNREVGERGTRRRASTRGRRASQ